MEKTDMKISDLLRKIDRSEIKLPEMQRKYVWSSTQIRDLFDSLYRGYPTGSILTWEPGRSVETRDFAINQKDTGFKV